MPIGWIQPDLFLRHQGVAVYHVYRNDEYEQGPREYWFTTDKYGGDYNDPCSFDVRELSTFAADKPHDQIICEAIEAGVLPLEERDSDDGSENDATPMMENGAALEFCFEPLDDGDIRTSFCVYVHAAIDSNAINTIEDGIASYAEAIPAWQFEQLISDVLNSLGYAFTLLKPERTFHI